jgi:predicted nucleic acid-binding protein
MSAVVLDASTVVAALIDGGPDGRWAELVLASGPLAAPHLMPAEAANILRRAATAGKISADAAALAHADFKALRVELFPYAPFADRIWKLRSNLTCYDGWYVALAEYLDCPLATLDGRIAQAPGVKCRFISRR